MVMVIFLYILIFFKGKEGNLGFSSIFPGPVIEYYLLHKYIQEQFF